ADDDDPSMPMLEQERNGRPERIEAANRRQRLETQLEVVRAFDRPAREHLPQHGVEPRGPEPRLRAVLGPAPLNFRHRRKPDNVCTKRRSRRRSRAPSIELEPPWKSHEKNRTPTSSARGSAGGCASARRGTKGT